MNVVAATDFRNNFSTYLGRVSFAGEDFYIKKGNTVVAKIIKVTKTNKKSSLLDLAGTLTPKEGDAMNKYIESLDTLDDEHNI